MATLSRKVDWLLLPPVAIATMMTRGDNGFPQNKVGRAVLPTPAAPGPICLGDRSMSEPTTTRKPRQRRKPQRFTRLSSDPDTLTTTLTIRSVSPSGKETTDTYVLDEIGSEDQDGRGFSL